MVRLASSYTRKPFQALRQSHATTYKLIDLRLVTARAHRIEPRFNLTTCTRSAIIHVSSMQLVELKNGSTFNGHLVACDNFMNLTLREVYETSAVRFSFPVPASFLFDRYEQQVSTDTMAFLNPLLFCCISTQSGEQFWKQKECYIRGSTVSLTPPFSWRPGVPSSCYSLFWCLTRITDWSIPLCETDQVL